jgi:deoxycytidylate deaminase
MNDYTFDWADLAFGSKKAVKDLGATFITAPRELSAARFTHLVKSYLPSGHLIIGLAKEDYIAGFEDQPQFKTLISGTIQKIIDKVNQSNQKYKIYTLKYFQRETKFILEKVKFKQVLFVNGSWKYAFHNTEVYAVLATQRTDYQLISPFVDEAEAREYEARTTPLIMATTTFTEGPYTEKQMVELAHMSAKLSYDYNFQTGVAMGKKHGKTYEFITYAYNKVVPFQTYAMLHGASREKHFSPPHDLTHYDTVHAEVEVVIKAQKESLDLKATSLFTNLLPCPTCSRMLCDTDISEIIYSADHSEGYAVALLEKAGKTVRRMV